MIGGNHHVVPGDCVNPRYTKLLEQIHRVDVSTRICSMHRASRVTRPGGQCAPPKAAIFCPPASLRAACGALHHGATRAYPADKILAVKWVNISETWYQSAGP